MTAIRLNIYLVGIFMLPMLVPVPAASQSFEARQLRYERVREAKAEKDSALNEFVLGKGLKYPLRDIFIRAFKRERIVELWARDGQRQLYVHVKTFALSAFSGELGPKRVEGDMQIPEGFYTIDGENSFNPLSNFHLSMLVDYPNASDRIRGVRKNLGGEICVHGNRVTIGCLPITDDGIKELYWIAVCARSNGQGGIPIHIFPARLDSAGMEVLRMEYAGVKDRTGHDLVSFWENLQKGYSWFEERRLLPRVRVTGDGTYTFY